MKKKYIKIFSGVVLAITVSLLLIIYFVYKGYSGERELEIPINTIEEIRILENEYKINTLHLFEIERVWLTRGRDHSIRMELSMKKKNFNLFLEGVEFDYREITKPNEYDKTFSSVEFDENWGGVGINLKNINDEDIIVRITRTAIINKPETSEFLNKFRRNW
ncbi:hypothetical protein RBH29_15605 [Herbivorax sp. ANBcel31]|uniref:hypothetical protein n=1 Tax=Herbivorax sp. ANBcel31 TaxID=3069754 RepID=UPI0027B308CA|nr:hypothetical protein [Herbivorax sp. ANBcel31]MDQ2087857.1 hypothetical protein [Herbivorax sp. ANBcel31]